MSTPPTREQRIAAEIAHGRWLLARNPAVWTWRTVAGRRRADRRAARIVAAGGFRSGQRLLEIGCGIGVFTGRVADLTGAAVTGVDVSPELVAEARRRLPGLEFEVADAHALPWPDASFSGVFGSSVLHHLEIAAALAEVRRVLEPGGRVVFAEPNLANPLVLAQKRIPILKRRALDLPHEIAFLRAGLADRLRRAGFTDVRVEPFDFLHPLTPDPFVGPMEWSGRLLESLPAIREIAGSVLAVASRSGN